MMQKQELECRFVIQVYSAAPNTEQRTRYNGCAARLFPNFFHFNPPFSVFPTITRINFAILPVCPM
jgi:hypothetical protein